MNIQQLLEREKAALEEAKKLRVAIKAFQEVCQHEWADAGHDSHHNYKQCKICEKNESC